MGRSCGCRVIRLLCSVTAIRIIILIVGVLTILETWGVPTTPVLMLILVLVLAAALALRDAVPSLLPDFSSALRSKSG